MKITPDIKTPVPGSKVTSDFLLQKMGDIYSQANGNQDTAHRHNYYTILFVEEARGKHLIDYRMLNFYLSE